MLRMLRAPRRAPVGKALCAQVRGVNIHASKPVPGTDRRRLERLCRYAARPPLSQERLELQPDGRVRLGLKAPWADGTTAVVFTPLDFIARLCAAIPPPRFHRVRFHGVLAPHCTLRPKVAQGPTRNAYHASSTAAAALRLTQREHSPERLRR